MLKKGFKQLLSEAHQVVLTYTPTEAKSLLSDERVVFVDVRDAPRPGTRRSFAGRLPRHTVCWSSWLIQKVHFTTHFLLLGRSSCFIVPVVGDQLYAAKTAQEMGLEQVAYS